jgi:hypothetical protein
LSYWFNEKIKRSPSIISLDLGDYPKKP